MDLTTFGKRQVKSYTIWNPMSNNECFFKEKIELCTVERSKVNSNESRYKQCGVTPHFSTGKKIYCEQINIDIII